MTTFFPLDALGAAGVAIGLAVSLFLLLKLYGIALSLAWAAIHGRAYAKDLLAQIPKWKTLGFDSGEFDDLLHSHRRSWEAVWSPGQTVRAKVAASLERRAIRWLYRWPALMIMQACVVTFSSNPVLLVTGVALLLLGLWLEIAHVLTHRLTMGCVDSYFGKGATLQTDRPLQPEPGAVCPSRSDVLQEFSSLFVWLMVVLVLGYAGVYSGLHTLHTGAFRGLDGTWAPLNFLYFSVVTVATVGYGDIVPATILSRLVTASEVVAGFSLVVFFATAFTLTLEPDKYPV